MRGMGHEHDHAEEAEEARRGAADGTGGPLAETSSREWVHIATVSLTKAPGRS
jgi:hypothetical protein